VHQLVALTFLGPRPAGADICHADGNPRNNAVRNLRYDTRRENIIDEFRQGKAHKKLTANDAKEIRRMLAGGYTGKEIAEKFMVSQTCISNLKNGRTFRWLKEPSV
jgi:DNA invertase Pin-like site-specific DNA recombinase